MHEIDLFRQVMSNFATGVTIVTTVDRNGQSYGLTVSSFASLSLEPLLVLACLDNKLSGLQFFRDSMKFGVSILSEAQEDVSRLFARKDANRPADVLCSGPAGMPLIRNALATLECEVAAMYPGGDHTIFMGKVVSMEILEARNDAKPLLYFRSRYERLGNSGQ